MSYQCAIDAVTARCFPSHAMRKARPGARSLAQLEYLLVAAALPRAGRCRFPTTRAHGLWAAPHEPDTGPSTACAPRSGTTGFGLAPGGTDRAWGIPGGGLATA